MNKAINYIDVKIYKTFLKKLNFGCGDVYKEGFINTDIKEEVTYNRRKEPDIYCDFTNIYFDNDILDEILFSHTLEHFQRHEAIILLMRFNKWLKEKAILDIFVPDINACYSEFINANYRRKKELIRHIHGSHEGFWAIHMEGYFNENLKEMLFACGFDNFIFKNVSGQWPYIEVRCEKIREPNMSLIENYLHDYSPDVVGYPNTLIAYWMNKIKEELEDVI